MCLVQSVSLFKNERFTIQQYSVVNIRWQINIWSDEKLKGVNRVNDS